MAFKLYVFHVQIEFGLSVELSWKSENACYFECATVIRYAEFYTYMAIIQYSDNLSMYMLIRLNNVYW